MDEVVADAHSEDWAQVVAMALEQGQANMAERTAARRWLHQEASTTLALCLAGMGGALAYAAPWLTGTPGAGALARGAAWSCAYLAVLSAMLIFGCLLARSVPPQFNEPANLLEKRVSLVDLQWGEALALQERIARMSKEVHRAARWLNGVRVAAALLPAVFLAAAWWPGR